MTEEPKSRLKIYIKAGIFAAVAIGLVVAWFAGLKDYVTIEKTRTVIEELRETWWGPLAMIFGYATLSTVGFSGLVLTVFVGAAYGWLWGTLLVVAGSNLGANGAFFIARYLGRDFIESRLKQGTKFKELDASLREKGLFRVIQARLLPFIPFNLLNFACGLTSVKWRDYALGSLLGMLPGTFAFVYFSSSLMEIVLNPEADKTLLYVNMAASVVLLVIVSLAPTVYRKLRGNPREANL